VPQRGRAARIRRHWLGREPPRLVAAGLVLLVACALAVAPRAAASGSGNLTGREQPYWLLRGPGVTEFGAFAGYVWRGKERSVAASWLVPEAFPGPHSGLAGTWIGAQAPGGGHAPFIQVGINEGHIHPLGNFDYAFFSDTALGFHPRLLFRVNRGDRISARLRMADGRWHVLIVDHTHPHRAAFSTAQETGAAFNQAEWLQEDPSSPRGHLPYPRLSAVHFWQLRVDGQRPGYGRLLSQWMSENHMDLAPGPLVRDGFWLAPTEPTEVGLHYMQIAVAVDLPLKRFYRELVRWNAATPPQRIAAQEAAIGAALATNVQAVSATSWPGRADALAHAYVAATDGEIRVADRMPTSTTAGIRHWSHQWVRANAASVHISQRIRRALHLPQLFPLPRS